jgi:hypothetical protein
MARLYLAVIGDVVGSREVVPRAELQTRLEEALDRANETHRAAVQARFLITIGDEFQGLLKGAERVPGLLSGLRSAVHPVELRFGLGFGGLDTELREEAIGMDGPAFHRAREAIERARERGTPVEVETGVSSPAFTIYSLLYASVRRGWTERQRQVFDLAAGGLDGVDIANRLGITPAAVSQHLSASGHRQVLAARDAWFDALAAAFEEGSKPA